MTLTRSSRVLAKRGSHQGRAQRSFRNTGPAHRAITWPLRGAPHTEPASVVADGGRGDRVRLYLLIPRVWLGGTGSGACRSGYRGSRSCCFGSGVTNRAQGSFPDTGEGE